jgi:hypothetical protein
VLKKLLQQIKTKRIRGFPCFGGNEENEYITRHIAVRHLAKLNTDDATKAENMKFPKTESCS